MRALVVDDDAGIRWVLRRVLSEEGLEVCEADSIAAVETLLKREPIDLVFLDVYLPDGVAPLVAVGQSTIAGETVLADLASEEPARIGAVR